MGNAITNLSKIANVSIGKKEMNRLFFRATHIAMFLIFVWGMTSHNNQVAIYLLVVALFIGVYFLAIDSDY